MAREDVIMWEMVLKGYDPVDWTDQLVLNAVLRICVGGLTLE